MKKKNLVCEKTKKRERERKKKSKRSKINRDTHKYINTKKTRVLAHAL